MFFINVIAIITAFILKKSNLKLLPLILSILVLKKKVEKIIFSQVILKLECFFYQNIYIYIYYFILF